MTNQNTKSTWAALDYAVIVVISVSLVAIGLFIFDLFQPKQALLLGAMLGTVVYYFMQDRSITLASGQGVGLFPLLALLFLAAGFRVEPYPWINGGQDQGVYVSMSSYYQKGGKVFISDPLLADLNDSELAQVYKNNLPKGGFQPGVYYRGEGNYVFQFYHLHPLWMAIFADVFGDDARVYSLTFFSFLSIIFLSLLAFELSNSRSAALSVGVLLALNPLHAFFSKWPVTEVVALAFSSIAFYYLARAWRLAKSPMHARWAIGVACFSLSMLFFVRISGFLYLPVLFFLFATGVWLHQVRGNRFGKDLIFFALACIGLYLLSVFYGLKFSPNYSRDIYRLTFGKFAGGNLAVIMSFLFGGMSLAMFLWYSWACRWQKENKLTAKLESHTVVKFLIILVVATIGLSFFQVYRLGFTDAFASDPWLGGRWKLSGAGMAAVVRSSALNWMIYTSPFLLAAGGLSLWRCGADLRSLLLLIVPVTSLTVFLLTNPVLPYQYYYARYLLTEAVPYAIVVLVVATVGSGCKTWRKTGFVAVVLSGLWFGFFTAKQFGAEEGVRPLAVLKEIASRVGEDDVLLIEPNGWEIPRVGLETPLRFYFGLKTFVIQTEQRKTHARQIAGEFRKIWLLSPRPVDDEKFTLRERLLHYDKVVERVGHVPLKVVDDFWHQELYLYEMKKTGWPSGQDEPFRFDLGTYPVGYHYPEMQTLLGNGWHAMEISHVWSSDLAELVFDAAKFTQGKLPAAVVLDVAPFAASTRRPVSVAVEGCGGYAKQHSFSSSARTKMRIPITLTGGQTRCLVRLIVDKALSPAELGVSSDSRKLGIALFSLTFE